jgi:hypothetical protein
MKSAISVSETMKRALREVATKALVLKNYRASGGMDGNVPWHATPGNPLSNGSSPVHSDGGSGQQLPLC